LRGFLRAVCGLIARKVTGRERGLPSNALKSAGSDESGFWDARPFSRVVAWGKDFAGLKNYLHMNRLEAIGFSRHESRGVLDVCRQFGLDPPLA
jgi:hypothetical protein